MKKWYLVQRCQRRESPKNKTGVDKILAFDYMGSSEFEFGALGDTIKAFRKLNGAIKLIKSNITTRFNKHVWVVVPDTLTIEDVDLQLIMLSNSALQLKERSYFDYWFHKGSSEYMKEITSWLVLGADPVFFSVDEGTARKMLAELKLATASPAD